MFYISKYPIVTLMGSDGEPEEQIDMGAVFSVSAIGTMGIILKPTKKLNLKHQPYLEFTPAVLEMAFTECEYLT
tara:strand:- start:443 stop:664 length:222 start_codon:yes stop_codon:yes gene_type:complete